ncbi:phage tail tube protein [Variovorax sp. V15]|uniref:phage tail tube protein n=1 Tax=Variovorax sp. V15 TaxID=3065952 RepID=UPI0034E89FAA
MNVNIWSNVGVDVQTALAAAVPLESISKANPAVAGADAHPFLDGDIILLRTKGMRQLDWAVVRVDNKTTDTFELKGIDSTDFKTFVSGTAQKITFGTSAETFQDVSANGGEAADVNVSTIHNDQDTSIPGNRTPLVFNFGSIWDPHDPVLQALKAFDTKKSPCAVVFNFATGDQVYFAATPSASLAPGGSAGAVVTTPVKLSVRGRLTNYAGA